MKSYNTLKLFDTKDYSDIEAGDIGYDYMDRTLKVIKKGLLKDLKAHVKNYDSEIENHVLPNDECVIVKYDEGVLGIHILPLGHDGAIIVSYDNDFKPLREEIIQEEKLIDLHIKRIQTLFEKNGVNSFIQKVKEKYNSDSYKDREYSLGREPENLLYYVIFSYAQEHEKALIIPDNDDFCFTQDLYLVGDYIFEKVCGQGCYIACYSIKEFKEEYGENSIVINELDKDKTILESLIQKEIETIKENIKSLKSPTLKTRLKKLESFNISIEDNHLKINYVQ
jgi:hypothetical protein